MSKVLLVFLVPVLCAGPVFGQVGYIQLTTDPVVVECNYTDLNPQVVQIYVVHKSTPGASSSRWMLQPGGGFTCIFMGEFIQISAYSGSTQTGFRAMYTGCQPSDILIAIVEYYCLGTCPSCAFLAVVADPTAPSGQIEIVDCEETTHFVPGSSIIMNDYFNTCGDCTPTPTEATSWGRVKTLYR